jgi:hypothetical protein
MIRRSGGAAIHSVSKARCYKADDQKQSQKPVAPFHTPAVWISDQPTLIEGADPPRDGANARFVLQDVVGLMYLTATWVPG